MDNTKNETQREPWTKEELDLLKMVYSDLNNEEVSDIVGRTASAVAHKAARLRLRKSAAFLKSKASGRFLVKKLSIYQRLLTWLRSWFS